MSCNQADKMALPEMQQSLLDPESFEALIRDISQCAQIHEIIPKFAAEGYVGEGTSIPLAEGCALLRDRKLRALQLRYTHAGSEWWDTLMNTPAGIRLVRVQHNFSEE